MVALVVVILLADVVFLNLCVSDACACVFARLARLVMESLQHILSLQLIQYTTYPQSSHPHISQLTTLTTHFGCQLNTLHGLQLSIMIHILRFQRQIQMKVPKISNQCYRLAEPHFSLARTPKAEPQSKTQQQLKTFVRVKPLLKSNVSECVHIINEKQIQLITPNFSTENDRVFNYERVFGGSATNRQLFETTMIEPIHNVLAGFNSTVFIYGMTGAGKSYTMFNQLQTKHHAQDIGLIGQTITRLFTDVLAQKQSKFEISVSFYEIYNENIRDLLSDSAQNLSVLQDPTKGVFINDLTEIVVESEAKTKSVIQLGLEKRAINSTKSNLVSSRSHAILQLNFKKYTEKHSNQALFQQSKLFMIDLAGNQKTGQNQSKRFIQGVNINKSLLTLGKCINILSEQKKAAFIPFRDSKLTRILKDSLGGNSKTVMIACISSDACHYQQTVNTLKYSSKAKRIKNSVKSNIKTILKSQLPSKLIGATCSNLNSQHEETIYSFVNNMQSILKKKNDMQRLKEEMQSCLYQNQKAVNEGLRVETCKQHIRQIKQLLLEINHKLNSMANQLQQEIQQFTKSITQIIHKEAKNEEKTQNYQTNQRDFLLSKHKKAEVISVQSKEVVRTEESLERKTSLNIIPVCLSDNFPSSLKNTEVDVGLGHKKHNKSKIRCIKIEQNQGQNKENVALYRNTRPFTPENSIKSCNSKKEQEKSVSFVKEYKMPKISINISSAKLQHSDSSLKPTLIQSKLKNQSIVQNSSSYSKQTFSQRLKKMDKNPDAFSSQAINYALQELDRQKYEISKVQKSMVNKLKFLLKNREREEENQSSKQSEVELRGHRDKSFRRV